MPKGIYKHDKVNSSAIQAINSAYSAEIQSYKDFALKQRKNRRYDINEITKAAAGMIAYVKECMQRGDPATIAGVILAANATKDFYYKAKSGDYDYIAVEYMQLNNITANDCLTDPDGLLVYHDQNANSEIILSPISEIIEKILLIIESDLQTRTLTDKSMARTTGAIFNLKAVFNYNDKPETDVKTVNNTLIVNANPDQTAKAMQLLLDNK